MLFIYLLDTPNLIYYNAYEKLKKEFFVSYIDKNLLDGEKIQFRTRKHIILFFWPFCMIALASFFSFLLYFNHLSQFYFLQWVPWMFAALLFTQSGLEYLTSEFVVTNKRVMMREGFFIRHATELRIAAIAQVNIQQSLLGQFLNYGVVALNAFGVSDAYSLISKPYLFQRHIATQLDALTHALNPTIKQEPNI
jgi:uncharacterized membrane protein YdbT with pleckstrin-like domain